MLEHLHLVPIQTVTFQAASPAELLLQQDSKSKWLSATLFAICYASHMHQHTPNGGQEPPITRGFQWEAWVVCTGNVCCCASVRPNRWWRGSENCLISHQLSRQTVKASTFCCSQAAPPHGLPSAAGSPDARPRMLAGAESL